MRKSNYPLLTLLVLSQPIFAAPPNPTASDAALNTAGGTGTLFNVAPADNFIGSANTGFGSFALTNTTAGSYNTAFGSGSLQLRNL